MLSRILLSAAALGAAALGAATPALSQSSHPPHPPADHPVADVRYQCADSTAVRARYYPNRVRVTLPGGEVTLPQTPAASGIRYANDTLVFWSKGPGAFVTRRDSTLYADCHEVADSSGVAPSTPGAPVRVPADSLVVDETGAGATQVIPVGGSLTIKLREQRGTGYIYRLRPFDLQRLKLTSNNSVPTPGTLSGQVGGSESTTYVFEALAPGATIVAFDFTAPGGVVVEGKTLRYAVEIARPDGRGAPE
ncbi:hypothetical protein tb265_47150 [Gemmatimonadetes bacterium T265]|nr:hypothetical protein tb265_47150 [Gemmatimonadetes bacterium T265]